MGKLRVVVLIAIISALASTPVRAEVGQGIGGVVTDSLSASAEGVCVTLYQFFFDPEWGEGYWAGSSETRADVTGHYLFEIDPGTYRVRFSDCEDFGTSYLAEFYNDKVFFEEADDVVVLDGQLSRADAVLERAASITGTLTNASGEHLEDICVSARNSTGELRYGDTDWNGMFTIGGLRGGDYKVHFEDCYAQDYLDEWFNDKASYAAADAVAVVSGAVTGGIDAELELRDRPDLAVTDIRIDPVSIQTDLSDLPSTGTVRDVTVRAENLGIAVSEASEVVVWAETESDGRGQYIGRIQTDGLAPGAAIEETIRWNGTGTVGDVTIHARACEQFDGSALNDEKSVRAYVIVGGSGTGFRFMPSTFGVCDTDFWG